MKKPGDDIAGLFVLRRVGLAKVGSSSMYWKRNHNRKDHVMEKSKICVWYDKDAEAAARFYAATFPNSSVGAVHRAAGDFPSGKKGDVLIVEFNIAGIPCIGLNGGPAFKQTEAFS